MRFDDATASRRAAIARTMVPPADSDLQESDALVGAPRPLADPSPDHATLRCLANHDRR